MIDYSFINGSNISSFIEQKYIDIAHAVIHNVEERYLLDAFDEEFIAKFTSMLRICLIVLRITIMPKIH